jgi:beta-glucosidase
MKNYGAELCSAVKILNISIMKKVILLCVVVAVAVSCQTNRQGERLPDYLNDAKSIETRIEDALERMTLEEKIDMLHAQSKFSSPGVPRLGIPEVWCTDGPHGIREEVAWDEWYGAGWTNDSCTAFPALTALAATWDPELAALYGRSIGEEARYRGKNVLLGPGVNIYRTPLGGRNFEYMGEDPFLSSTMVVPYIKNVQEQGVAACVKHFALNNQEDDRFMVNVSVSDRALYEIYLPAFKAAVQEGGAWAIMGAYNRYKDQHCCHNQYLLNDILKGEWEFDGVVISDWGGVHDTREAALNGLDMEFGTWNDQMTAGSSDGYDNYFMATPLLELVKSGEIAESVIDDKVRRILRLIFRTTMDRTRPFGSFATPEHFAAARRIAEGGIVLLQNQNSVLPFEADKTASILVVGENATKKMTIGGGSSSLKVKYEVSPLEGIRARYGADHIKYMKGYSSEADSVEVAGSLAELVSSAASADAVLFIGGLNKNPHQDSEEYDRLSLGLPYGQDEVIAALAAANPRTAVVILSGNAVAMPWKERVGAIVQGWYLGSEAGNALAAVIAGDVNPSGKLPFTYYSRIEDCGAHVLGDYPGEAHRETYVDDIWVGYRYTEMKDEGSKPNFVFGHGLSYTTFEYTSVVGSKDVIAPDGSITVTVTVKNSGNRRGSEVVQLYIGDNYSTVVRPIKELKGFKKITLEPGKSTKVTFTIDRSLLEFFNDKTHRWTLEKGNFTAFVGSSSADIRGVVEFAVL